MIQYIWLVPLLPLLGVIINGLFGRQYIKEKAHWVAVSATGLSFLVALSIFFEVVAGKTLNWDLYTWVAVGDFKATIGFQVDPLSAVMMLVVTFVGFLIHVYSIGYMHGDPGYYRFFAYMNLFMLSMLTLVLANNYFLMFLGWEGVGLCSYLLIGFWFEKKSAADAGKKAFVVNRVGDAGFLLGLFLIWSNFGTLKFVEVFEKAGHALEVGSPLATAITLLLFLGAVGKSAQLPLYVWLPDAMEGPTPVSALIHAATMVTAGVYMVARSNPLYNLAPLSMDVVAITGALTAAFAASIALVQNDIKRIIAYSTISQLGYMFLATGVGAYASGIFHLATHAFFKALLFLGAGSVIHALRGEQDIRRMGGLLPHMRITGYTFLVAALANSGIPPFAGFFSKDEILYAAISSGRPLGIYLWALGAFGAFMTAFYMFRLFFLTFTGEGRMDRHLAHHIHESPPNMAIPLVILGFFSLIAGFFGFPPDKGLYHRFVAPVFEGGHGLEEIAHSGPPETFIALISVIIATLGIGTAYLFYLRQQELPDRLSRRFKSLYSLLINKYWVDEIYQAIFVDFGKWLCHRLWGFDDLVVDGAVNGSGWLTVRFSLGSDWHDIKIVDGLVNGIGRVIQGGSQVFKRVQTGLIQNYILAMAMGIFFIFVLYLFF